jgi:hypothetical protein
MSLGPKLGVKISGQTRYTFKFAFYTSHGVLGCEAV